MKVATLIWTMDLIMIRRKKGRFGSLDCSTSLRQFLMLVSQNSFWTCLPLCAFSFMQSLLFTYWYVLYLSIFKHLALIPHNKESCIAFGRYLNMFSVVTPRRQTNCFSKNLGYFIKCYSWCVECPLWEDSPTTKDFCTCTYVKTCDPTSL